MRFAVSVVLHAVDDVPYTETTVEAILDALHESDAIEDIDAVGALAARELELDLVVVASDIDTAWSRTSEAIRFALRHVGGRLVDEPFPMRATTMQTRELVDA